MAANVETLVVKVQSDGITKTNREIDNLGKAADNTEKKVLKLVDSVNAMASKFASSVSGTKALTDALSVVNRSTMASDAAMKSLATSVGKLSAEVASLSARMQQGGSSIRTNTVNINHNTTAMNEAHAAARGLTGSLGVLWLTYGNLAPMIAGAAIGASMKEIISIGKDVENTLENIRIKGENTAEGMEDMRKAIVDLGQGVYGPQEVAKALESLTLAGLKAKDAVTALGAAQNLALVGGTDIEKAAESLVTIGTAVGATSKEFDYMADGISKAANISLASVDSISEAVKRASVVNKLYGATFEDILTQTAALAQLGIKNTAAGTAITNFYANAMGSTEKAKKALDDLGFSFQDATGKAKPLVDAYEEFTGKLNKFDVASQKKIIMDIFGERALRDVEGLRDMVNSTAESTERLADGTLKYKNRLEEVRGEIEKSAGTSALQAAQMAQTTENQMKAMLNTLKSSFGDVYKAIEPQLRDIVAKLREAFASEDFKTGITNIAKAFISVADAIASNIGPLTAVVEGFLTYSAITAGGKLFSSLIPVLGGVAIQFGLIAKGTTAATIATTTFGRALTLLPGIGMLLAAAGAAMALYSLHTDEATKSTRELAEEKGKLANTYNTDFLKSLEAEADRLDKVNQKLAVGLSLQQAEIATTKELALEKEKNYNKDYVDTAQKSYDEARKEVSPSMLSAYNKNRFSYTAKEDYPLVGKMLQAQEALNKAKQKQVEFDSKAADLAQKIIDRTAQQQEQLRINANTAEAIAEGKSGDSKYVGKEKPDSAAKKALSFLQEEELELKKVAAQYDARTKALMASYESGAKVTTESRQAAVMANNEEGKYLSNKIYLQEMALAKTADEAKANYERKNQYVEIGKSIKDQIEAERARAELEKEGLDPGKWAGKLSAAAKYGMISKEQLATDMKLALALDAQLQKKDDIAKLESSTKSSLQRAEQYADEMASLDKYGQAVKQTALEFAKAEIAKRGFTENSKEGKERLSAAGLEDYQLGLRNITKEFENLQTILKEQEGVDISGTIGAEQAKVLAYQNTKDKFIEFEAARVAAGLDAEVTLGKITQEVADKQLKEFESRIGKLRGLMEKSFKIDFKAAGLNDIANIFDNMADAADRLGSKFAGPVKALDAFSDGFKKLSKIEKASQGDGKKYAAERVGAYADMLDGAKNFFHENTTGYKVLEKAAQVASAVQLALNIQTMASNAAMAVSGVIAGAANMFAQSGWGGFAGVAAMGAVMAGLGMSIGGGSSYGTSAETVQKTQGTGSVLGAPDKQSESIKNALDLLEEHSSLMLPLTNAMLKSLQNIEASISGVANMVAGTNITSGKDFGVVNGQINIGKPTDIVSKLGTEMTKGLLGPVIGGAVAKFMNNIWGKTKQTVVDSGIQFGGSVDALQSGQGYNQYASIDTTKSSFFGLKKKTTNSVQTMGLDQDLANQFGQIFTNLEDALKASATGFGKTGAEVGDAISSMVIEQTTLSLKGLSGDELTAAINAVISKTMDDIAKTAMPGLTSFQQIGEGYAQTVIRVASGIEQGNVALEAFNITAIKYTDIVNKQGDVAAEIFRQSVLAVEQFNGVREIVQNLTGDVSTLAATYGDLKDAQNKLTGLGFKGGNLSTNTIKGAGGLDNLKDSLQDYFDNILTEDQQLSFKNSELTKSFADMGLVVPASKDAFTALIKSFDDGSESGDKLVGKLLGLSKAFSDVGEAAAKAAKDDLDNKMVALKNAVDRQKDVLTKSYNDQVELIKKKAEEEKNAAKKSLSVAQDYLKNIQTVFTSLESALKSTEVKSDVIDKARRQSAQNYLKSIAGTDLTKADGLNGALSDIGGDSEKFFSTFEEYAMDQAKTASLLDGLKNQAGVEKTLAELTVERLNDTIQAIEDTSQNQLDQLKEQHEQSMEALQAIVDNAQMQIDALNGVSVAVLTVNQALSQLASSIATQFGAKAPAGDAASASIDALYKTLLGRSADATGMAYYLDVMKQGHSLSEIATGITNDYEYKNLRKFDIGTNYVTEDTPAIVHEGERIMPKSDNVELMRRLDDNSGSVDSDRIAALEAKIATQNEERQAEAIAMIGFMRETAKTLRKWDNEGFPEERDVTA